MSFLNSLLDKKNDDGKRLEKYLNTLMEPELDKKTPQFEGANNIPYAQTMSIFEFARIFTKVLNDFSAEKPESVKKTWVFQYDRIFAEVVAFYYYVVMREFLAQAHEKDVDFEDDYNYEFDYDYGYEFYEPKSKSKFTDPYFEDLKASSDLANEIITKISEVSIHPTFINKRILFYSYIYSKKDDNVVDVLHRFILKAWNPKSSDSPSLDRVASELHMPIMTQINVMPINEVRKSCRSLYDELSRNQQS
jgi:hypothetical protein